MLLNLMCIFEVRQLQNEFYSVTEKNILFLQKGIKPASELSNDKKSINSWLIV